MSAYKGPPRPLTERPARAAEKDDTMNNATPKVRSSNTCAALLALLATALLVLTGCPENRINIEDPEQVGVSQDGEVRASSDKAAARNHFEEGNKLLDQGNFKGAIKRYTRAIKSDPRFQAAYENRAIAYMNTRQFPKALDDFAEALEIGPESARLYHNLGNLYAAHALYEPAIKAYKRALELEPGMSGALNNLGNCYSVLKRFDEAESAFEEFIRLYPDRAEGHNNLGIVYEYQNKLSQAESSYRKAISLDPTYPDAHFSLGAMFMRSKDMRQAVNHFQRYLELAPEDARDRDKVESMINNLRGRLGDF